MKDNMKRIITLVIFLFYVFCVGAQFVQRGVTLEYNRNKAKTTYTKPVSIRTDNAEPSVSNNGSFALTFTKATMAGDTIKSPDIRVGDEKYVLFNKDRIRGWVLTPKKDMEILVCKKEIVDYLESTYTNNYVNQLKKNYEQSQRRLRESTEDAEILKKELAKLKTDFEREVNMIRARAVLFAYVDETEKDSLELLRRECILNNDLERALKIGDEMDLGGLANNYITNLHKSKDVYARYLQNLHDLATILEEQIQIYKTKDEYNLNGALTPYYESLTEVYKCLHEEYKDSKQNETLFNEIEDKLGKVLYDQDKIEEAAQYENTDALLRLAEKYDRRGETENPTLCKNYLKQLLSAVKSKGRDLPQSGYTLSDYEEWLESFPDFIIESNGSKFEYTILNNEEVSLVHYVHGDSKAKKVVVPKEVEYEGKKYTVTKIGCHLFFKDFLFYYGQYDKEEESCMDITSLQLPNTITYIGTSAFAREAPGVIHRSEWIKVNMPNSLKVICDNAFYGCFFKNFIIDIPEGVEYIGDAWESWEDWETGENFGLTLRIPASAKEINIMKGLYGGQEDSCPLIHKIELDPKNIHFKMINGLLYKADSTYVYAGGLNLDEDKFKILYIPSKLRFENEDSLMWFFDSSVVSDGVDSLIVDSNHPDFTLYEGILYDKNKERLILKPKRQKHVFVPLTLKDVCWGWNHRNYSASHYTFPKEINPDVFIQIMADKAHEDTTTIDYYGITGSLIAHNDGERLSRLINVIDTALTRNLHDPKLTYIKGMLFLELYDINSATKVHQQALWNDKKYEEMLGNKIEKSKNTVDSLRKKIDESLEWLSKDEYLNRNIVEHQEKFAEWGTEWEVLRLAVLYYLRGLAELEKKDYGDEYKEMADRDFKNALYTVSKLAKGDPLKHEDWVSNLYSDVAVLYYNHLAVYPKTLKKEDEEIVDKLVDMSLEANPKNTTALETKGLMYLYKQEPDKARQTLEKIKVINENHADKSLLKRKLDEK